jgi:predicted SAM-dependent methyltransferase
VKYEHSIGLLIGIPTLYRPCTIEWALALRGQCAPINYNANMLIVPNESVAVAREQICEEALRLNTRYVYFIGDDTEPPLHTLRQFIFRMENDPELGVVGGIYCSKSDPPAPLVFRGNGVGSYWDWKIGEYFEVSGLGMDCTLIRTDLLRKLPKPWFRTIDKDDFLDGKNFAEMWTEDLYFCKQVLEHTQYKIFADATVLPNHWDAVNHKCYKLPPNSLPMRRLAPVGQKRILDIGCGEMHREFADGDTVRVDIRDECNPDYRCDIRQLPFGDEEFDIAFSSHVLEHFDRREHLELLKEWLRVVKRGGEIRIVVPSIQWAAERLASGEPLNAEMEMHIMNVLYGAQSNPYDYHKTGFTPTSLATTIKNLGCEVIKCETDNFYNIFLEARKT